MGSVGAFFGAQLALLMITELFTVLSLLPINRGDITIEEFSENFNQYAQFYGIGHEERFLDGSGKWIEKGEPYSTNTYWGESLEHYI